MRRLMILVVLLGLATPCIAATYDQSKKESATTVVVSQGQTELTLADIDAYAAEIPADQRAPVFADPQRIEGILRGMLLTRQLANEAVASNDKNPVANQTEFSRSQLVALSKARIDELRSNLQSKVPDMQELARERYLANPKAWNTPKKVDVKHILISTKNQDDTKAKALAETLYADLQQDPSQFAAFVVKYSDDKSKKDNHGLIEDANSDRTVKAFSKAADSMTRIGEIIGPIETSYGYHILKAIRIVPARQPTFAEIKPDLVKSLQTDWISSRVQSHIDALRSRKIDANPSAIASLRTRYLEPLPQH